MTNHDPLQLRAQNQPWKSGVAFLLYTQQGVCPPVVLSKVADHQCATTPSFVLNNAQAQILMDDLWICGFRPTEGSGSAGSLAATQKHLEDMRRLVFNGESKK